MREEWTSSREAPLRRFSWAASLRACLAPFCLSPASSLTVALQGPSCLKACSTQPGICPLMTTWPLSSFRSPLWIFLVRTSGRSPYHPLTKFSSQSQHCNKSGRSEA